MRVYRFFINGDIGKERLEVNDSELFNQLRNVLRLSVGSHVSVADGKGREALAEIKGFKRGSIELQLQEAFRNDKEPAREVTLYCSILKRENFELVVQKATEAGGDGILKRGSYLCPFRRIILKKIHEKILPDFNPNNACLYFFFPFLFP